MDQIFWGEGGDWPKLTSSSLKGIYMFQVVVRGLSRFETGAISADTRARTLAVRLRVPQIDITGLYKIKGR